MLPSSRVIGLAKFPHSQLLRFSQVELRGFGAAVVVGGPLPVSFSYAVTRANPKVAE